MPRSRFCERCSCFFQSAGEGKLAAAGPIEGDYPLSEILNFSRIPAEEAERLAGDDPVVKAGVFRTEFHRRWCAEHVLP